MVSSDNGLLNASAQSIVDSNNSFTATLTHCDNTAWSSQESVEYMMKGQVKIKVV